MKRVLLLCLCFLFFCGCASSGKYEEGYAAGYDAGYKAALENRAMPDITPAPTAHATAMPRPTSTPKPSSKPTPVPTPAPTPAPTQAPDDFTVYVSRSGTMHLKENCSGMTHSTPMPYSVASQYYDKKCGNCFKSMPKN